MTAPITITAELGCIFLARDGEQFRIEPHEAAATARAILATADACLDAE